MTDREKLVELLTAYFGVDPAYYGIEAAHLADHLLAHGVIVLPCKVGDTVYVVWGKEVVEAVVTWIRPFVGEKITEFRGDAVCTIHDPFYNDGRTMKQRLYIVFGKDAFATREEAEAALKEGQ